MAPSGGKSTDSNGAMLRVSIYDIDYIYSLTLFDLYAIHDGS